MSERKVIQKYYPPDFDPSSIKRTKGPKQVGPKTIPVRLMAPFSMRCNCGSYIYKGRKFNAKKEITEEAYYAVKIIRFYIRCPACSGEISFKTDPRNADYVCEKGAKRNFEPWRDQAAIEETDEQRLDRLEAEEAQEKEREAGNAMEELEGKVNDAKTEMAVADALDDIRTRNARIERGEREGKEAAVASVQEQMDEERMRQDREDEEAARRAFTTADGEKVKRLVEDGSDEKEEEKVVNVIQMPTFQRTKKRKNGFAIPGVKKKVALV